MVRGNNLRKGLRLGRVGLVAADAEYGRIQLFRGHGGGIIRVPGQRSVARFAVDVRVFSVFLLLQDVSMAAFARLVAREIGWPGGDLRQCVAAIVPVLSKTLWDQERAEDQEEQDANGEDSRQSKKMSRVLKGIHGMLCRQTTAPKRLAADSGGSKATLLDKRYKSQAAVPCITVHMYQAHTCL